ncbi:MAG: TIGR04084 family radical SAM/SPASM domain-containing protein [Crenarchaeota archaeon]|nr:TIGR04084 family radical SAM/SPASM domain-containing protein [Thermoproteota archaeon]
MRKLWFIILTGKCNLRCRYCGGSFPENLVPYRLKYDPKTLRNIISRRDNVCFYGGEPLLNIEDLIRILLTVNARKFIVQTNGTLIHEVPRWVWSLIDCVLLSIDGVEEVTDKYRGKGVYRRVIEAAKYLRKIGYRGEIIARMTVTEDSDIYRDVTHLLKLGLFDKIHWQLNVIWYERWEFEKWAREKYLPGMRRLVKLFLDFAERGIVLKIVPITGVLTEILFKDIISVPCGAGYRAFAINSDGRILACPIAVRERWAEVGNVLTGVQKIVTIGEPCTSCSMFKLCGGRCLYAYYERSWGEEGFEAVCEVTCEYLSYILKISDRVRELVRDGIIRREDIFQDGVEDSTEIIP